LLRIASASLSRSPGIQRFCWCPERVWFCEKPESIHRSVIELVFIDEAVDLHGAEAIAEALPTERSGKPEDASVIGRKRRLSSGF
jgi:hypothetical protein